MSSTNLWPQDRLELFWSLQKRVRKDGNSVTSRRIPGAMGTSLIVIKIGGSTTLCNTVEEAVEVYDKLVGGRE